MISSLSKGAKNVAQTQHNNPTEGGFNGHPAILTAKLDEIPSPASNNERGKPEYEPSQLVALLHPKWKVATLSSQVAHATRIVEFLGADIRFAPQLGWLGFDGRTWERDDRNSTRTADRVKGLSQKLSEEAAHLFETASALAKFGRASDAEAMARAAASHLRQAKHVETKAFVEGALHFVAGNPQIRVKHEVFDQKPWLLGFENGVWASGRWRRHQRKDFLLNLCPVEVDFDVDISEWKRVLVAITGGDNEFALTLQDIAGYILSGASHLRFLPWLYGPKGTGKSTFAELLQTVLGPMSANIDPKKFKDDAARERLGADLWNRRLAVCAEAGGQKLEAELLKTLSGSDLLPVRLLYQEAFNAIPRHVLLMVSNDAPRLNAYDDALKDRVVALPFIHRLDQNGPLKFTGGARIEAVRKDPNSLLVKGFALWALEGLARVYENQTVYQAPCTKTATAQFWADTDPLTPFWETIDEDDLAKGIAKAELRGRYERWCEVEGARPFNRNLWARACESAGLEDYKGTGGVRFWRISPSKLLESGTSGTTQPLFQ